MDEYCSQNTNPFSDTVVNFRFMPAFDLEDVKNRLQLPIELGALTFCQSYYREAEHRDPTVQELTMICEFIAESAKKPSAFFLSEIKSTNMITGDAFEDVLRKFRQIGKTPPYSFLDLATAADNYLKQAGKTNPVPGIHGKCANFGSSEFCVKGCTPVAALAFPDKNSFCTLGVPALPRYSHKKAVESDSFVAIYPYANDTRSFCDTVRSFLTMPNIANAIKRATTVEENSALSFLLSSAKGFFADLTCFPGYEANPSPTLLTTKLPDVMLALVEGKSVPHFLAQAQALGLRFSAFAKPADQSTATVKFGGLHPASFNADFLRSIKPSASLCANAEAKEKSREESDAFTVNGTPCFAESAYLSDNVLYCAATTKIGDVKDAASTVIAAVSPLVAAGVDFCEISVSFDARLPLLDFSGSNAERAFSMLMGQYRAQSELCLISDGSRYLCTNDEISLSCYARARLPQTFVTASATRSEGDIFVLAPHTASDGLLNFDELRDLYKHITALVREGKVTAVRAVTRSGVYDAIRQMTGEATLSEYTLPDELVSSPLGAFILESSENLAGLKIHYIK